MIELEAEIMENLKRTGVSGESKYENGIGLGKESHLPRGQAKSREGILTTQDITKRDRKRQQIAGRLQKLEQTLDQDRDTFYHAILHQLQDKLASLQQGTNDNFIKNKETLEEQRDYELTRLRLWEEHQVRTVEGEYKEDLSRAKEDHDRMIKMIKEKLYDKLQGEIKRLKEDKLLLNMVNAESWRANQANGGRGDPSARLNLAELSLHAGERRSLRKREIGSRFTVGEMDDLSDGAMSGTFNGSMSNNNGAKRRRDYQTRYSSNEEVSSGVNSATNHRNMQLNYVSSSGYDSNLSDKDYDALNSLIMDKNDGISLILFDQSKNTNKSHPRSSHRQYTGLQGLKPEELNEDLALIRNATSNKEK